MTGAQGGPIPLAQLSSRWSHQAGGRQRRRVGRSTTARVAVVDSPGLGSTCAPSRHPSSRVASTNAPAQGVLEQRGTSRVGTSWNAGSRHRCGPPRRIVVVRHEPRENHDVGSRRAIVTSLCPSRRSCPPSQSATFVRKARTTARPTPRTTSAPPTRGVCPNSALIAVRDVRPAALKTFESRCPTLTLIIPAGRVLDRRLAGALSSADS